MDILFQKIRLARRLRRLSMSQLVSAMGKDAVSKMAISKIERGQLKPSLKTLQNIANVCNVPIEFFSSPNHNIGKLNFRFREGTPIKKKHQVTAQVIDAINKYIELQSNTIDDTIFAEQKKPTALHNYLQAEVASTTLRKKWNIGIQPIFSVYELLQNHGIRIIEVEIDDTDVDGVSTFADGTPYIIINTLVNKTVERKRFTALHELAHLLFIIKPLNEPAFKIYLNKLPQIPYTVTVKPPTVERLCHRFAGAMLLPEQAILRRIGTCRTNISMEEFISIHEMYGISIAATVHRLHDLRIIDDDYYNHLFDNVIKPNNMETGWGTFPIQEKAEMKNLLKIRIDNEIKE
ncbi:MAG: XRE family transcriptional regulator [Bacteroidaceae bacterium]|nr:XRE family transcriptional regulator [Bacteroidaceae bacterium]